ncbi:hypothetical protein DMC47_13310 [Nostoc sp. 3335mG]|nr:hypothetical protein DMC47_13310 [Nostoc sp. 3335mG]
MGNRDVPARSRHMAGPGTGGRLCIWTAQPCPGTAALCQRARTRDNCRTRAGPQRHRPRQFRQPPAFQRRSGRHFRRRRHAARQPRADATFPCRRRRPPDGRFRHGPGRNPATRRTDRNHAAPDWRLDLQLRRTGQCLGGACAGTRRQSLVRHSRSASGRDHRRTAAIRPCRGRAATGQGGALTMLEGLRSRAFLLRIRDGQLEEYKRRHADIWPRMLSALQESGCVHYDIYVHEPQRLVFGHMLYRPQDPATPEHPVILEWRAYMADVLEMDGDQPLREPLVQAFHLRA